MTTTDRVSTGIEGLDEIPRQEVMRAKARQFYTETLRSRLDNPRTGSIIAIMQRLHEDDFPAFLLAFLSSHSLEP